MRIVRNLKDITECPNCGSDWHLRETEDQFGTPYVMCLNCYEELYDGGKAPDDIDDSLMKIEYAVSDLTRYSTTKHELEQMERIRDIFDELISVIRRMKQ